jgi:PII-like signaling protein
VTPGRRASADLGFHRLASAEGNPPAGPGRHVPVVTVIIDTPDNIAESFNVVDELTQDQGLVTSEMVPAVVSADDDNSQGGPPMARHRY